MNGIRVSQPINRIRELLRRRNGLLLCVDLQQAGIPRAYLSIMERKGEIERVARGVYVASGNLVDEMAVIQAKYHGAIFSHATALYLLGLSDRSPLYYSMTLPSGYNASSVKASGTRVYFVQRDLLQVGLTSVKSSHGNDLKTYDLERTICDVLRNRKRMDVQQVNEALKRYVVKKDKNLIVLQSYARQFNIHNVVRQYIEVLL